MDDLKKVIYSIERCICHVPDACQDCSYDAGHPYNECVEMLLRDALELLKAQEPIEPIKHLSTGQICGSCKKVLLRKYKYCPACGQAVKWE